MFVLIQVCHIVLGLRPGTPEEEGQIIRYYVLSLHLFYSVHHCSNKCELFCCRGWLERESRHGLQQGQNWFLISMLWWQQWKDYVKYVSQDDNCVVTVLLSVLLPQEKCGNKMEKYDLEESMLFRFPVN